MKISKILILSAAALSLAACGGHTHTFASEWTYDETNHWHAATCEHTEEKSGVAAHTLGTDGKCTVCDYTIPKDNKVTKEEWEAAFGLDKPYYMADNYNAVMRMNMEDETVYPSSYLALQVDGLKAKMTNKEVCTHEEEQFYEKVNNVYNSYLYGQKRENKWDLFENVSNPARNFANFLEPIVCSYSSFTYNQNDSTYKCVSLDYEGTILTNVSVKFVDKKVVNASFDSTWGVGLGNSTPFHWTFEIVYGGQTVTLPTVPSVTTYNVSFNGVKCTSNAQASYNEGQEVTIQITPNEGYAYPQEVYVYGGSYSYNKYDGTLKFTINEDTTIYCASFEKPKYYLSAEYNDEVIHSRSELSEDGKELVSTWYYETVDVRTYSYENGRLTSFKEVEKLNEGDVESDFKNYTYENGNIVRVDFPDDEDGTKNFELREYDEYNRITKSVLMWGEEAYNLTTFEYPDNFTCISKWYFENFDFETEERIEECRTTIKKVAIDIEHNTKRVDYVESYRSSEEEYNGYEVYTFDTGKLIERLYSDWSAYDIFEYNEYGDMISNITSKYDSDTDEWHEDTKVTIEYNEDRSLKHVESASPVDSDKEHGYFTVCDYVCNENGLIVSEIDKSYDDGDNYYTRNATFEYKELKFDLYDDDHGGRTNINYGRTIGTYDLDFWYGF